MQAVQHYSSQPETHCLKMAQAKSRDGSAVNASGDATLLNGAGCTTLTADMAAVTSLLCTGKTSNCCFRSLRVQRCRLYNTGGC